jgi:glutamate-1-semialdehyde 2,1-aminomutase/spore coat polysaccharide biosynthesis protein SpsF
MDLRMYDRSREFRDRARATIPIGTQTFSKAQTAFVENATPLFLQRGSGSHVVDVDGNEYIDYILGLGPITLGYDFSPVNEAVKRQVDDGPILSLPHPKEVVLTELLTDVIPAAEMVRFGKNGSDATSAAVRLARAYTEREKIAICGYHGWQDWYVASTTRDAGVPECIKQLSLTFEYNDLAELQSLFEEHRGEIAAVIMEPMGSELPEDGFLEGVRDVAHDNGALLVFDEVLTGFRVALGGAQEHFGVTPDLACFGKGMSNGFPLSAVVGREDVMRLLEEVFFSFTYGGDVVSITAALETIKFMRENDVVDHMWDLGSKLQEGATALAERHGVDDSVSCTGLPPWTVVGFDAGEAQREIALKSLFQQEVTNRGILFNGNQFLSFSHTDEDVAETLEAYDAALAILRDAIECDEVTDRLEGEMIQPVFDRGAARTGEE